MDTFSVNLDEMDQNFEQYKTSLQNSAPEQTFENFNSSTSQDAGSSDMVGADHCSDQDRFDPTTFPTLFVKKLHCHGFVAGGATAAYAHKFIFQSFERNGPIPNHSIYFTFIEDSDSGAFSLGYESYCGLRQIYHPSVITINCWSQLDEFLLFVFTSEDVADVKPEALSISAAVNNPPNDSNTYQNQAEDLSRQEESSLQEGNGVLQPSMSTLGKLFVVKCDYN